jgi:hypothetical protein
MHFQLCQPVELGASRFGKSNAATPPNNDRTARGARSLGLKSDEFGRSKQDAHDLRALFDGSLVFSAVLFGVAGQRGQKALA